MISKARKGLSNESKIGAAGFRGVNIIGRESCVNQAWRCTDLIKESSGSAVSLSELFMISRKKNFEFPIFIRPTVYLYICAMNENDTQPIHAKFSVCPANVMIMLLNRLLP